MEMISFASHSWSELLASLTRQVHSSPFGRKVIVVGSPLVKSRILDAFLQDKGVAFGVKILDLSSAMDFFHHICGCAAEKPTPSVALLSMHLELILKSCDPLKPYLDGGGSKRLSSFADRIARLFLQYGKYGGEALESWEQQEGWQQVVWHEVKKTWSFPVDVDMSSPGFTMDVHLFGLPFIPEIYQRELAFLSKHWDIYAYHFSPSMEYWEDLCTEKQQPRLEHGDMGHALLANFGTLGKKMFDFYQTQNATSSYLLRPAETLLASLQNDVSTLGESIAAPDSSLQLHAAPSKRDEVEGLCKTLLTFIEENPKITPDDIVVYAPDISEYFPYIQFCFGRDASPFGFSVEGLASIGDSELAQGIKHLFALSEGRWQVQEVLKLLHFPTLLERFKISKEEVVRIRELVLQASIRWGQDSSHQSAVLSHQGAHHGSWESGISDLLFGMASVQENIKVEINEAPLLGKLCLLIESLKDDLSVLSHDQLTVSNWIRFIRCLGKAYFQTENWDLVEVGLNELAQLRTKERIPFAPVRRFLEKVFAQKGRSSTRGKNVIRFQSLKAGNVVGAKVLWVMGMEEGSFPRPRSFEHLDHLKKKEWAPDPGIEDRYAGLELLLMAEEKCVFSYVSQCPKDGKEVGPSLLVTEIERSIKKKGAKFFHVQHAPIPFAEQYFGNDAFPHSFTEDEYLCAKQFYMRDKELSSHLFPEFYVDGNYALEPNSLSHVINIKDLVKLMRNPFQLYFNETLQIYEKSWDGFAGEEEKEFVCSPLDRYLLRQEGLSGNLQKVRLPQGAFGEVAEKQLQQEIDKAIENFHKLGLKPEDRFSVTLTPQCTTPYLHGKNWVLPPLKIAINEQRVVQIFGTLEELCENGVLVYQKKSPKAELTALPKILIWAALPSFPGKKNTQLLYIDKGNSKTFPEENAISSLIKLIEYYDVALEKGSPLHPLLFEQLFLDDEAKAQQAVEKIFQGNNSFLDDYLEWITLTEEPFAVSRLKQLWGVTMESKLKHLANWMKTGEVS